MRGHVDAESLALCAEGLLSRRRSERVRSHVATCPECAAAQARLTEVPALLAQVPPPSLPPGIAARLDAALSAEAARRAVQDPGYAPEHAAPAPHPDAVPSPGTGRPGTGRSRGPWLGLPVAARVLATAGVLVIAGGIGYAVSQPSSTPSTSGASGPRAAAASALSGPNHHSTPTSNGPATGVSEFTVSHSGTTYQKGTFPRQAAMVAAQPVTGLIRPGEAQGQSRPDQALIGCVKNVAGPGAVRSHEVKLVDQARYGGRPATVIVVQATPAQAGMVYVAGTRCSASDADLLARAPLRAAG
jgi:hypothetical protein